MDIRFCRETGVEDLPGVQQASLRAMNSPEAVVDLELERLIDRNR